MRKAAVNVNGEKVGDTKNRTAYMDPCRKCGSREYITTVQSIRAQPAVQTTRYEHQCAGCPDTWGNEHDQRPTRRATHRHSPRVYRG